jgi:hypothetical protein
LAACRYENDPDCAPPPSPPLTAGWIPPDSALDGFNGGEDDEDEEVDDAVVVVLVAVTEAAACRQWSSVFSNRSGTSTSTSIAFHSQACCW